MGAVDFESHGTGETVAEAYDTCVKNAQHDYGHAGYTGTIAEKDGYHLIAVPDGFTHDDMITALESATWGDEPSPCWAAYIRLVGAARAKCDAAIYDDKWGPCIAMAMPEANTWCFAGYASS